MLQDALQRTQATDPEQSFIVQAPAGSGKTELLTQRYLRLLGGVNAPEQIIALTFTRKAASEMRARILFALKQTANGATATSPHQQKTFYYAAQALARSEERGWQLLEQPGRLNITTIDSFCQMLSHAIPLQEKQIPYAQINEKPQVLYQAAAKSCLAHALNEENLHAALSCLLQHLDNRQDRLIALFSDLLASREQWLTVLYSARPQKKTDCEHMLQLIEQHELHRLQQCIPSAVRNELCAFARELACIEANSTSLRYVLREWLEFEQLDKSIATGLASLLLTSQNTLRQGFDYRVGLQRGACDNKLYETMKARGQEILGQLAALPDFLTTLIRVKNLPSPQYAEEQWQVLQALFTLLPLLVAHLHLVFSEHNQVDFIAISQQAFLALGDEEQPTDLTLYLDNTIQHLLIDEFQDTSIAQFQLLTKLVRGWQTGDGRTLFVVGDPMQSIYRFRQAEVGLFLKAKQQGIGSIRLIPLQLCCNFRSTATLVNWVNSHFCNIFPPLEDIELGAVSFHASVNVRPSEENCAIGAWQFSNRSQEADALITFIKEELAKHPEDEIAILVRSRGQLNDIVRLLREQQIPFQGVEIELLAQLPHLRDLWSLTQALLMPGNRLAWLAILRSPWCGLSLQDLHLIANFAKKQSIYYALSQLDNLPELSSEGRKRAQFIYNVLRDALARRHQYPLVEWLIDTLKNLHSDKIFSSQQQADIEQFWLLLERFTEKDQLPDLALLQNELQQLYSQTSCPSRLQVMTIHKSKGLEFDCVILPGLSARPSNPDQPLLRWLNLPNPQGKELTLISPIKAAHHEQCLLYDYLGKLSAEKDKYELQRLLYVATTRAKKRLYLFDSSEKEMKGTFRQFLKNQPFAIGENGKAKETEKVTSLPLIYRLASDFYQCPDDIQNTICEKLNSVDWTIAQQTTACQLGIVAHELLQWICDHHPKSITELPWQWVASRFKSLGFNTKEQEEACQTLHQQIQQVFHTEVGQWLISSHDDERNEYELLIDQQGIARTRIIDRTFRDQGIRWIIDFKSGGETELAQGQHRQQVEEYARLITSISADSIRCGLYYLASGNWLEWDYVA